MKKLALPLALLVFVAVLGSLSCQTRIPRRDPSGEVFPQVSGRSLSGTPLTLPDDVAGAPILLLVGYVQDAQFDADRWALGLLQAGAELRFLELPTIPGLVPGMLSNSIDSGMRRGIPSEDEGLVVTVYGQQARKIERFTGSELPRNMRALLLDAEGRVVWFHDEGYSPRELLELIAAAEALGGDAADSPAD